MKGRGDMMDGTPRNVLTRTGASLPSLPHGPGAPYEKIAVVGAGAWGTALAVVARVAGRRVSLWGRDAALMAGIAATGRNERHLAGIDLPDGIHATSDLAAALARADAVLLVTPSHTLREMARAIRSHLAPGVPIAL